MNIKTLSATLLAIACSYAASASPVYPHIGAPAQTSIFKAASDGDVIAYFYGSSALFRERLGLLVNGEKRGAWFLPNHTSKFARTVDFGPVHAGDTLTFLLRVNDTGYTLSSDPRQNPDGMNYLYSTAFSGELRGGTTIPAGLYLGFEDSIHTFSDFNYADEAVVVTNAARIPTPEPASAALFGSVLIVSLLVAPKRRK